MHYKSYCGILRIFPVTEMCSAPFKSMVRAVQMYKSTTMKSQSQRGNCTCYSVILMRASINLYAHRVARTRHTRAVPLPVAATRSVE